MIEREFLFWVIFGTSFISYSIGYFLWLFVHWYYDERPKTRTFKVYKDGGELSLELNTTRTLRLLDASGKNPPWPGKVLVRDLSWKRKADGTIEVTVDFVTYKDPEVLVVKEWKEQLDKQWEENMQIIKENNKKIKEVMVKASKKLQDHIEKEILSSPAKTSGEPEKEKPTSPPPPPIDNLVSRLGTCPICRRKAVLMMSQDCCYRCY